MGSEMCIRDRPRTVTAVTAILGGLGAALMFSVGTVCSSRSSRMIGAFSVLAWVMLTGLLVMVVLFTTTKKFAPGMGGLVIGITLTLIHLISIPVDNTSVNPARSLGTALFADTHTQALQQLWAFIVFPLIGSVVGVIIWLMLDDSRFEETAFAGLPGSAELRNVLNEISDVVDVSDD